VWFVSTRQDAEGWTVEMAIPFKSLRFTRGAQDVWGINFSRRIRRKNEVDLWSPVPRAYNLTRLSLAGNLAGLSAVSPAATCRSSRTPWRRACARPAPARRSRATARWGSTSSTA